MSALAGRLAVVSGASRGIGAAVAAALAAEGAHVVRLARGVEDGRIDGHTLDLVCDVTDAASVARARDRAHALGVPDVLVNNAGGFLLRPFGETGVDAFREQIEVNLVGAFQLARAFVPEMAARGRGRVITIGSVADHRALPGNAAYAAAKWGLRGLHEVLASELAPRGLLFTLLSPGPTDTALWDPVRPDGRVDLPNRTAMLRPEDVAEAVRWVATRPDHVAVPLLRLLPA